MKKIYLKNPVSSNDFYKGILQNFNKREYGECFNQVSGDQELQWCLFTGELNSFKDIVKQRIEYLSGSSRVLLGDHPLLK